MSKDSLLELFSLKALAAEESISYSHMKKLMMDIAKNAPREWRGWKFLPVGAESKRFWLAYKGKQQIVVHNEPKIKQDKHLKDNNASIQQDHSQTSNLENELKVKDEDRATRPYDG